MSEPWQPFRTRREQGADARRGKPSTPELFGVDLDGNQLTSASGWGFALGLLAPLPFGLRLGLSVQDLGGTSLEHDGGVSEQLYDARYRLGLAHKPIEGLTIAAGLDAALRFGAEYWIRGLLALRAGMLTELDPPESFGDATTASFGLGVKYRFATLDYAYERHPILPPPPQAYSTVQAPSSACRYWSVNWGMTS